MRLSDLLSKFDVPAGAFDTRVDDITTFTLDSVLSTVEQEDCRHANRANEAATKAETAAQLLRTSVRAFFRDVSGIRMCRDFLRASYSYTRVVPFTTKINNAAVVQPESTSQ